MSDASRRAVEHHLEVRKTARYWTLGRPETASEVWVVLHGYKQLARRFLRRFESIDDGSRLIVAPEALSRFYVAAQEGRHGSGSVVGATWMTREDRLHEIGDYVRYLDGLADHVMRDVAAGVPLTVLGFSQGVATATRWVVQGRVKPGRLILWGDFTPPDLDGAAAARAFEPMEVVLVRGDDDPALSPDLARTEAERLAAYGIDVRRITYSGGHDIDAPTLQRLAGER